MIFTVRDLRALVNALLQEYDTYTLAFCDSERGYTRVNRVVLGKVDFAIMNDNFSLSWHTNEEIGEPILGFEYDKDAEDDIHTFLSGFKGLVVI